jgi:hypothetical protein
MQHFDTATCEFILEHLSRKKKCKIASFEVRKLLTNQDLAPAPVPEFGNQLSVMCVLAVVVLLVIWRLAV